MSATERGVVRNGVLAALLATGWLAGLCLAAPSPLEAQTAVSGRLHTLPHGAVSADGLVAWAIGYPAAMREAAGEGPRGSVSGLRVRVPAAARPAMQRGGEVRLDLVLPDRRRLPGLTGRVRWVSPVAEKIGQSIFYEASIGIERRRLTELAPDLAQPTQRDEPPDTCEAAVLDRVMQWLWVLFGSPDAT